MPTLTEFLENSEIFPIQSTLNNHPQILNGLVDYASTLQNPLLANEQQCYVYPNKSTQILSLGTAYRCLVAKKQRKGRNGSQKEFHYPFLERLFKNILDPSNHEETLLGYVNKILVSLTKKTPQIYEFFKDSQEYITDIISNNSLLTILSQFFIVFISQSTMTLYIFLKNIVIRSLMYRIIDQTDIDNKIVYQVLDSIYSDICNKLRTHIIPQDQRQQLIEVSHNFHQENYVTLMVFKISLTEGQKTFRTAKYINNLLSYQPQELSLLITNSHLDTLEEYFQNYEESSFFMDLIGRDQLQMLKIFVKLSEGNKLTIEQQGNVLKRLLVYSSIHRQNTVLHCLLFDTINSITQGERIQVFNEINVIPFFMKNNEDKEKKYSWKSLIFRICHFWKDNQKLLFELLQEEEKSYVNNIVDEAKNKRKGLSLYGSKQETLENQEQTKTNELQYSSEGSLKGTPEKKEKKQDSEQKEKKQQKQGEEREQEQKQKQQME